MDRAFLLEGMKALLPITLIFTIIFFLTAYNGDFHFHIYNYGQMEYPPATAWLIGGVEFLVGNRFTAVFLVQLFATAILPYLLVVHIVKWNHPEWSNLAGWVYLYGSGVPFVLFFGGAMAQAIIQVLMLLSVANPIFLLVFAAIGFLVHHEWFLAFFFTLAYILIWRLEPKPVAWFGVASGTNKMVLNDV